MKYNKKMLEGLCDIMKASSIAAWMERPNDWFDGQTPNQAIKDGKINKVWELIYHTREGGFK